MKSVWVNNIDVFEDTRKKSTTTYYDDTATLLCNTWVYDDADSILQDCNMVKNDDMQIKVVLGGTVSTAYKLKLENPDSHVAFLNFADAKRPGGWVVEGAPTQEENICRCTNLYETLIQPECLERYYRENFIHGIPDAEQHYNEPYTDALIYAENVAIFKDDSTYASIPVNHVDVITSPAPCGEVANVEKVLLHRMKGIVKSAYYFNVTHLVLGAWGCGAFGQDPIVVAKCFAKVLKEFPVFEQVIFAIRPTVVAGKRAVKDGIFMAFADEFAKPLF